MLKSYSKLILVSFIVVIAVITVIIFISTKKSSPKPETLRPTPSDLISPTPYTLLPTPLPIQDFTGAETTQQLPDALKNVGEQKTALRRLTPLTLSFGTVEFDYENDNFLVLLFDPKEESKLQFTVWRTQTYPALTEDKFIVY